MTISIRDENEKNANIDTGDNLMTMLLKPSYTAQESQKSEAEEKVTDSGIEITSLLRGSSAEEEKKKKRRR